MIGSQSLDALNAALSAAQGEFETVAKSKGNPFFKSSYAPLPEVVKAAAPILAKHGLAVWQGSDTDERGELLWTVVLHKSGQFIGSSARLLPIKNDPQAQGSAVTYQRRYQYMAALGLVADEDDDGNAASGRGGKASKPSGNRTRPTPQATRPEAVSGPQDGPGEAQRATEDTLAELAKVFKSTSATKADLAAIATNLGEAGKPTSEWSEDSVTWAIIKLRERAKEAA